MRTQHLFTVFLILLLALSCRPDVDENATAAEKAALALRRLEENDFEEAMELFESALQQLPGSPDAPFWEIGRAEALLRLGNPTEAHTASAKYETSSNPALRARAFLLNAEAQSLSSPVSCLNKLAEVDIEQLGPFHAEVAIELCIEQLDRVRTDNLPGYRNTGWFEVYVLLELEDRYARSGDTERAILYGSEIDRLYPQAHEMYGRPEITGSQEGTGTWIALLLPLTGQGSEFAEQVSSGARLAFSRFAEMHENSPELIDFDTQGSESRLVQLMESLADNSSCVGVLGPLTSSSTLLAAPIAKESDLPLLTPTATSGDIDRIGEPVFRLVVSEGNQAAAVAEYAVREGGYTRFGVIYPYTAQATGEAEQFRTVVESLGGTVVSSQGYQPGSTDFKDQITVLKSYSPQAVFLPVSAWDAVQIAPQLRFYRLEVPLFGTSGWDDDLLLRHGGDYVEGAVFTAAFGLSSLYPETARFVYTYTRATGSEPTTIAAQGYDAAGILLKAWESASNPTRSRITRTLAAMPPYYGASGRCILGNASETRISWPMMTVVDGEIIGVE